MAAAFYGLIRLADAQDLEKELGPRLGMVGPDSRRQQAAGQPARKDIFMSEVQTQFKFEDLVGFFEADDVPFIADSVKGVGTATFCSRRHGTVNLLAEVDDERKVMVLSFHIPITVPEERRADMAEAITRVNYRLLMGSFEMCMRYGEVNFKLAIPFDDAALSLKQFRSCMGAASSTLDHYVPAFFKILFGGVSAEEAIDECDN